MKAQSLVIGSVLIASTAMAGTISPPSGQYSLSRHGSIALCYSATGGQEACSKQGATAYPLSDIAVGVITYSSGGACAIDTEVFNAIPPNASPPSLNPETVVIKVTKFDSTTGVGTGAYTAYSGGTCHGATFDGTGASEESSGTVQFVVTQGGRRVESVLTALQSPSNFIGSVSFSDTDLLQEPEK
jgi:hypothetical protein